jgi:plastocyanin
MTWRSATFFSLGLLLLGETPEATTAGSVSGHVTLVDSSNSAVKRKNDYSNVVVWLTGPTADAAQAPRKRVEMVQKDKTFSPHILVVPIRTKVDFPNLDPIFHNAFSSFDGQIFDVALYPPGTSRSVQFSRPGIVRVFCNIHPSMSAIIVVVDSTYFATSNTRGEFRIPDVAAGTYRLRFFHERATPDTLEHLRRTIVVPDGSLTLDPVVISEAGYLPTPHKNKYGRDYPAGSDETKTYSWPGL